MLREIVRMGDPGLHSMARAVGSASESGIADLVADMFETMRDTGGVGLAAPQIGVDLRVMVFAFDGDAKRPEIPVIPATALINPWVVPEGAETQLDWEQCLSIPGMAGLIERSASIRYGGMDETGASIERTASGLHARIVQHEFDHLNGVLYTQRLGDVRRFGFADVLMPEIKRMRQAATEVAAIDGGDSQFAEK